MKNGPNIADTLPEPANGTRLVRVEDGDAHTVIWRDDANGYRVHTDRSWFTDGDSFPVGWREILAYATAVYAVSEAPLATLDGRHGRPRTTRRPNQITVTQDIGTVAPGSSVVGVQIDDI